MKHLIGIALLAALLPAAFAGGEPAAVFGERAEVAGPVYKGVEVACDLPDGQQMKNIGGTDGAGLCVWTSLDHAARWQNVTPLIGFQKYMSHFKGGGWPDRVKQEIPKLARQNGAPVPDFIQYEGRDPAILDLALRTGRMPGVTYGYGERYGQRIAHMVNLAYFDDKYACVLDNNFPGAKNLEWMSRAEFVRRWTMQGGSGWAVVFLDPPPPPVPTTAFLQRRGEPQMFGLVTALTALSLGQWGGGGCGPVGFRSFAPQMQFAAPMMAAPVMQQPVEDLRGRWEKHARYPGEAFLMRGLRQYGVWNCAGKYFRPYDPTWKTWGAKAADPPGWAPPLPQWARDFAAAPKQVAAPDPPAAQPEVKKDEHQSKPPEKNFGMFWKPAEGSPERYTLYRGGSEVPTSKAGAFAAMAGDLVDDSGKCHLTVIGSKESCDRVKKDIDGDPHLSKVREKCQVQCYRPNDWAVQGFNLDKLRVKADPMIYVSAAGLTKAKVIYGQAGYRGAQDLVEGLRKIDPNFDPNPGPAPNPQPPPGPGPAPFEPSQIPLPVWLLGGGVVLFLLLRK